MKKVKRKEAIGAVFTPEFWAKWFLTRYGVAEKWLEGAVVADPSSGEGVFLHALVDLALKKTQGKVKDLPLHNLYGVDLEASFLETFFQTFKTRRGCKFPAENLIKGDSILDSLPLKADILVGNPPWQNFADLPEAYKPKVKQAFVDSGLTGTGKTLLLGGSRIDIAALFTLSSMEKYLTSKGEALFFLPLSLLLNEGAHREFRRQKLPGGGTYAIKEVWDFKDHKIFPSVETRYGSIHFVKGEQTSFPLPWHIYEKKRWLTHSAAPLFRDDDPLSVFQKGREKEFQKIRNFRLTLNKENKPRQGVNTCGAADIFIYTTVTELDDEHFLLSNKTHQNVKMLKSCVYPLVSKTTSKYIVILHDRTTGKPFSPEYIRARPVLQSFVQFHETILKNRKGSLIQNWVRRGLFWACLGVGPYNFFEYKVLWQAFGTREFKARIYGNSEGAAWQGNQAMHVYIPCHELEEARRIRDALNGGVVQCYLDSFHMGGSKSWAQPGKIKALLQYL